MSDWMEYSLKEIEAKLIEAIEILQQKDGQFLDPKFDVNERSVTHRLGMYLAEIFPDEDVDCEYNRVYNEHSDEYIYKNVELPKIEKGMTTKDLVAKTVYPDIIVHQRGQKRNLLAVEVKMGWKDYKGNFDVIKAEAYKYRLKYDYAAYLVLGPKNEFELKFIGV
jgi:hypothetical protein